MTSALIWIFIIWSWIGIGVIALLDNKNLGRKIMESKPLRRIVLLSLIPAMLMIFIVRAVRDFGSEFYYDWK